MDKTEYNKALNKLGLEPATAAWLFNGKSVRSGRRWAQQGAPYHVALLIALMQQFELSPEDIRQIGAPWLRGAALPPENVVEDDEDDE
jgi:hypothetical protein